MYRVAAGFNTNGLPVLHNGQLMHVPAESWMHASLALEQRNSYHLYESEHLISFWFDEVVVMRKSDYEHVVLIDGVGYGLPEAEQAEEAELCKLTTRTLYAS